MAPPAPAGTRSLVLFRVGPVEIAIHPSWLLTFAALALLARFQLVDRLTGLTGPGAAFLAIGVALLFYLFILLHEISHVVIARALGLDARRVTLFVFGGVAQIGAEAQSPSDEFRIAIAGPLASLGIAGVLAVVSRTLHPGGDGLPGLWGDLALVNLLLALFNLIPAFPLDGGRVLRAGLWRGLRDRARATRWAAGIGKGFAFAMMGAGGALAVLGFASGDRAGAWPGLWYVVLGYFLLSVAGSAGRLEGGAEPVRPPGPPAKVGRDEGQAPEPDAGARDVRTDQRPDAARAPEHQPGDRARDPRRRPPHP